MANTYTLIASNVLSSSAASVTFSSIPNTFTDLVVKISARSDSGGLNDASYFRLNATSANYSERNLVGTGSSALSGSGLSTYGGFEFKGTNGGTSTTNTFGNGELYIPNYTVSSNKQMSYFGVNETNATNIDLAVGAVLWRDTNVISSIVFTTRSFSNFVSGSSFFLYGILSTP